MELLKSRSDQKIKVCFEPQEIVKLALLRDLPKIIGIAKDNLDNFDNARIAVNKLSQNISNSGSYELFVCIFDLWELFNHECGFCFYLNNRFNPAVDKIDSLDKLYHFRVDPPDVIVSYQNKYWEFELKRYRGSVDADSLFEFINEKILNHYSDHDRNYYIVLQPKSLSLINLNIFNELFERLKRSSITLRKIAFTLNNNNKEIVLINMFPDLIFEKRPFVGGHELVRKILEAPVK